MTEREFIEMIGPKATKDYQESGILASITVAQACLESGYGSTELAQNANNLFGMKTSLSGNTWKSVWDGKSKYTKVTKEEYKVGIITNITADFRKYPSIDESIKDHSLYLSQAMNGKKLRYEGLTTETNYRKAIQIIKNGGYATDSQYVNKICNLIERWNLTQYDVKKSSNSQPNKKQEKKLVINPNPNFGTHNTSIRTGKIEYIVIHYVGATGDAKNNISYYNERSVTNASADFYVGHGGDIWQYNPNPEKRYCWAVGGAKMSSFGGSLYGKAKNSNCVSIEMCVKNNTGNKNANSAGWILTDATYNSVVELTKYLMEKYNIPAERVIRHYDVNGKYCPGIYGWNAPSGSEAKWNQFKEDIKGDSVSVSQSSTPKEESYYYRVRKSWNDEKSQIGAYVELQNAKDNCKEGYSVFDESGKALYTKAKKQSQTVFKPYQVKVDVAALNYRKGPSTNHGVVGIIRDKGIYTIVEEKDGWGKLKSGVGWICLQYTHKV